jgi:hypothetical protein
MTAPETPAPVTGMPRIGEAAPSFTAMSLHAEPWDTHETGG